MVLKPGAPFSDPFMKAMPKKGGGATTFASAYEAMNNLMSDLQIVEKSPDSTTLLDSDEQKKMVLNAIGKGDFEKFKLLLNPFKDES